MIKRRNKKRKNAAAVTYEAASAYRLEFGRYQGYSISEVWEQDAQYLEWLARSRFGKEAAIDQCLKAFATRHPSLAAEA